MTQEERPNRSVRTRKDLLVAASRLLSEGRSPTMEEVAKEALVSRATAYRYFQNIEELLVEAPIDEQVPDAASLFIDESMPDAASRIDHAEATMHEIVYKNEVQLRLMLSRSLARPRTTKETSPVPVRQSRRTAYIDRALAPHRKQFDQKTYKKLCASLALIFGTESMIVFRDVVPLKPEYAREVKSWAVKTLLRAAIEESKNAPRTKRRSAK